MGRPNARFPGSAIARIGAISTMDKDGTINVMLADDFEVIRAATQSLLKTLEGVRVVAEAVPTVGILPSVLKHKPDVLLLDVGFPNVGLLESVKALIENAPSTRILLLATHAEEEFVRAALEIGVSGVLLQHSGAHEFEECIHAVATGELYLSPVASLREGHGPASRDGKHVSDQALTPRHIEVLRLVASGKSSKQIAKQLQISPKTVEAHRAEIMRRLDIHDVCGLVRYSIRVGLSAATAD